MRLRAHNVASTALERDSPPPSRCRRSKRLAKRKTVVLIRSKNTNGKTRPRKMSQFESAAGEAKRRNTKRKAAAPPQSHALPDSLLDEALKPLTPAEVEEWDGWIELESEPAFFNIILRDLGVKDVKVQELFALDQDSLDMLPKPVFGLIFLFQYTPSLDDEEAQDEEGPLWFANQTTSNACATVALLNIVMNHSEIDLGSELKAFKDATAQKSAPVRGYELGRNKFIRKTHNSFARRMDFLNADLCLENESDDRKLRKRTSSHRGTARKKKAKKRRGDEYGFHFIAYVPSGGYVWELDGLRGKPRKLGAIEADSWTSVARPQIEARVMQYEESQLAFNLLSICQSPLQEYRKSILRSLAGVRYLDEHMEAQHGTAYTELVSNSDMKLDAHDAMLLAEFDLKPQDMDSTLASESLKTKARDGNLTVSDAASFRYEVAVEARAATEKYRGEKTAGNDDQQRVAARKKDYGSALHKWISLLADKGVLEDVIKLS